MYQVPAAEIASLLDQWAMLIRSWARILMMAMCCFQEVAELGIANAGLRRSEATLRTFAAATLRQLREAGLQLPAGVSAALLQPTPGGETSGDPSSRGSFLRQGPNRRAGTAAPTTKVSLFELICNVRSSCSAKTTVVECRHCGDAAHLGDTQLQLVRC